MDACIANLKYYSGWADKITGGSYIPVLESEKISCHTRREPVGVVAAVRLSFLCLCLFINLLIKK